MQESSSLNILKQKLLDCRAVKFGDFTLTSGKKSKFYVDMKLASTDPEILGSIAKEFSKHISSDIDFIAGMELGAELDITLFVPIEDQKKPYMSFASGTDFALFSIASRKSQAQEILAKWLPSKFKGHASHNPDRTSFLERLKYASTVSVGVVCNAGEDSTYAVDEGFGMG